MAFASSKLGAQEAILQPCDLCEEDENADWFCRDCDQNLCDRCKRTHLRSSVSKSHVVLSISDGFAIAKKNISNICREHDEPFSFYCRTCKVDICSKCLSTKHRKHKFIHSKELQSEKQNEIEGVIKVTKEKMLKMTQNFEDLARHKNQSGDHLKEWYSYIDEQVKSIKLVADEEGKDLKDYLQKTTENYDTELERGLHTLQARVKVFEKNINTVQQELRLQSASTLEAFVKNHTAKLRSLRSVSVAIPNRNQMFSEGKVNRNQIRNMIGRGSNVLEKADTTSEERGCTSLVLKELEIISESKLKGIEVCYGMSICPDGSVWIGGKGYLYMMNYDCSTLLCQIRTRNSILPCQYLACLNSGDVLVSYGAPPYVDKFTSDGKSEEFIINLPKRSVHDLVVTDDDEVVVNVSGTSIYFFSSDGKHLKKFMVDGGIETFCIDRDKKIVVVHQDSSNISILDGISGKVKTTWLLNAHDIRYLTCDRYGNGIAANKRGDIHILDENGDVKRSFHVDCKNMIAITVNFDYDLIILLRENNEIKVRFVKYLQKD